MASVSDTWTGLNSFMVTHNWWHQALFLLEQDRHAEVLALYDQQVWGVVKEYTQDQINAVSLLARLELAGVDVGPRWADVADHLALRLADHVLPFLDLQYLYGLARAGRTEAARALLNNITTHAATRTEAHERTVWQQVCVPAAHGLLAHAQGDWATAVEKLGVALPRLVEIGGSHAQRDLFHQIWLDALQRNGQWAAVQNLLQPLCNAQPQSVRLARQARRVNQALGLPDPAPRIRKCYMADVFQMTQLHRFARVLAPFSAPFRAICTAFAAPCLFAGALMPCAASNWWRTIHRFDSANSVLSCSVFFLSPR